MMAVEYINTISFSERALLGSIWYSLSRKIACNKYKEHSTPSDNLATLMKFKFKYLIKSYFQMEESKESRNPNYFELPGFPHCHLI